MLANFFFERAPWWAIFAAGVLTTMLGLFLTMFTAQTWLWPSTEGSVMSRSRNAVHYSYTVEGRSYTSTRFQPTSHEFGQMWASTVPDEGDELTVYYDPWSPESAVVNRSLDLGTLVMVLAGVGSMGLGLAMRSFATGEGVSDNPDDYRHIY